MSPCDILRRSRMCLMFSPSFLEVWDIFILTCYQLLRLSSIWRYNPYMNSDWRKKDLANPKPARIPPQTPPAGGKRAEAGRIHIPSQMFRPAESISVFRIFRKMGSDF